MYPRYPELDQFTENCDHIDVKRIEAPVALRPFIAGMLAYNPRWLAWLYRIRGILVCVLGLEKYSMPDRRASMTPETLAFTPGQTALFFTVRSAREECFWVAETPPDNHLTAFVGVVAEHLKTGRTRFHVFTAVRYKHWTGPVYFNLIRPFHHLVVWRMMKSGARFGVTPRRVA